MTAPIDDQQIGARVRYWRRQRHVTQADLAERLGLARTSISNIERGYQRLMVIDALTICRVIDVRIEQLLGDQPASDWVDPT